MRGKVRWGGLEPRLVVCLIGIGCIAAAMTAYFLLPWGGGKQKPANTSRAVLTAYVDRLAAGDYSGMYALLDAESQAFIGEADFIARNKNIYEGIEARNIKLTIPEEDGKDAEISLAYTMGMAAAAGEISFTHKATFTLDGETESYRLHWDHGMIFPGLTAGDRVRVTVKTARRGQLYDRAGIMLAGEGIVKAVGFVPGKMREDPAEDLARVGELLEMRVETIEKKLSASYVKEDTFVLLKSITAKDEETKLALLEVPGILISDVKDRVYPLGEKAAHVIGYVQAVNAEELAARPGEGYHANSKIGKAGLESLLEERLRARDGCTIYIEDAEGEVKEVLAKRDAADGKDITLTLDAGTQEALYDQLSGDKAAGIVMAPDTGAVLALVSTPAYDPNDFVVGIPTSKWQALQDNPGKPFYNRFKAAICPGSCFKPIIAGIGLSTGAISHDEDFGKSGRSWRKDESWGAYTVTTLKEYAPATMKNALIYSDNIYFAKAALRLGAQSLAKSLLELGFDASAPFEFGLTPSSFGENGAFGSEIQLADSGYGQGKILVNPVHLASLYSAFYNEGDMVRPHLLAGEGMGVWKPGAFTKEAATLINDDLMAVVSHPDGTAHEAAKPDRALAAKTGTAEIKASKADESGTELGWFCAYTGGRSSGDLLAIAMVEDVKGRGGSHYVIPKVMALLD